MSPLFLCIMERIIKNISIVLLACAMFLAGFLLRPVVLPSRDGGASVITRTDTLTVRDTVIERMTEYIDRTVLDTVLVAVTDTVMNRDTVYIRAASVQEHYKGEDYDAWVSGWELSGRGPALDSIYVYPQTRYITTETISVEPRKRWGIGIQAGYGIGISSGQVKAFPYIGVGISYDLVRW